MLEKLGVKKIINCAGSLTILGGTTVDDQVIDVMKEVARIYVDMPELHRRAGEYLAKLIGCDSAFVVNGAEAGLVISVAACMTRGELTKMIQLPNTHGMRNEVLVQHLHRNMYDHNIQLTGASIVEVGNSSGTTEQDLRSAINPKTAAIVYFVYDPQAGVLPLDVVCKEAHKHDVPVIADCAAELPPSENLTRFLKMGADLALFSGGKDIGAPNDTGLILGRRDLVDACMRLGPHNYERVDSQLRVFIGRPMKTSKEDIVAFIAALERYLQTNHEERLSSWEKKVEFMISQLEGLNGILHARKIYGNDTGQPRPAIVPRVEIELASTAITVEDVIEKLRHGRVPIAAYAPKGKLCISPQCLEEGEEEIVISRLSEILSPSEG
jgi:uncharacterized pyridoxal phosphate-dependent enzyme